MDEYLRIRFAVEGISNFHAVTLHDIFKRNGAFFAIPNTFERTLGKIQVFKIL